MQTTIRIPKQLKDDLKNIAKKRGLTLNALISQILWARLEKEKK